MNVSYQYPAYLPTSQRIVSVNGNTYFLPVETYPLDMNSVFSVDQSEVIVRSQDGDQTELTPDQLPLNIKQRKRRGSKKEENAPQKAIICFDCKLSFSTVYNKRRHDHMFHKEIAERIDQQAPSVATQIMYKCSGCEKNFNSIYNRNRHEATHKPLDERLSFKCTVDGCAKEYTTKSILKNHLFKFHRIE